MLLADKKHKNSLPVYLLTGIFLLILCIAVCIGILIRPYEKAQTYLNILFMDQNMKISPSSGLNGLVIKENNIETTPVSDIPVEEQHFYDTGEIIRPSFGEQYAVLKCDDISLSVPVYWGSTAELLERGACQASSSAVLGETGNVVIDAHVNTFFADLGRLETGNTVVLYTSYGIFTYEVSEKIEFLNTNKKYVLPTEDDRLTLYTCEAQVLGTSDNRTGVVCTLVSKQFYNPAEGANP
ncbi:MAG: class D sortase [Oscillospiraceae bacterium]|nr:class D sortase [Oscillospiraceae bacterium]